MKIMLAEDAVLMRDGLAALLARAGHQIVASAATAPEIETAIDRLAEPPDLLIADVRMPPGHTDDGLRAAIRIRQRRPGLPVLLLSQYLGAEYLERLLDATAEPTVGGAGYLLKDRIAHISDFLTALETIAAGGIVVDQKVMAATRRGNDPLAVLSDREIDVLRLVATGATNPGIAAQLHLSEGAVVKHLGSVFDKLRISGRPGNRRVLAVLAYLQGGPR